MFKIVQTIEREKKELTIVPASWEKNNILFWPRLGAYKLQKEADSNPEPNWLTMKCQLKRKFLSSYEIAEQELSEMCDEEDTEIEEQAENKQKRAKVLLPRKNNTIYTANFNNLADTCLANVEINSTPLVEENDEISNVDVIESVQTFNVVYEEPPQQIESLSNNYFEQEPAAATQNNDKLDLVLEKLDTVLNNQNKLMKEFAKFQAVFEIAMKKKELENTALNKTSKTVSPIEPINSLEELKSFNEQLNKEDIYNEYVERLSFICGRNNKRGKAIDHCYMLVDKFFTRNFFTLCSWAGGAKGPKAKFPFKFYENVINLFFKLIHMADNNFTLQDCEEFFKNVIRNSMRRNQCSHFRASKSKNRPKRLNYSHKVPKTKDIENVENKDINSPNANNHLENAD